MGDTDTSGPTESPEATASGATEDPETISFGEWRAGRPLYGGLALVVGGLIIAWPSVQFLLQATRLQSDSLVGLGVIIGALIVFLGVGVIVRPEFSTPAGLAGLVLATASFIVAFGGLLVGMLVASLGGILCFAWSPPEDLQLTTAESGDADEAGDWDDEDETENETER